MAVADWRPEDTVENDLDVLVESYRQHERRIFHLCLRHLGDPTEAQDATQETFMRAARHVGELSGDVVGAYLTVVARRICSKEAQRRRRHGLAIVGLGVEEGTEEDPGERAADTGLIEDIWERLPRRDRAMVLYRFAGYSYDEIGQRLEITPQAVHLALGRVRKRARRFLDGLRALLVPLTGWRARRRVVRRLRAAERRVRAGSGMGHGMLSLPLLAWGGAAALVATAAVTVPRLERSAVEAVDPAGAAGGGVNSVLTAAGVAVSPSYASDRTVVVSSYRPQLCGATACPLLLISRDGGRRWQRLAASGFAGGTVVLSPGFSSDSTMFASGPHGVQESVDGGRSFTTLLDLAGPVAALQGSSGEGTVLLVGAVPLQVEDVRSGELRQGPSLPPGVISIVDVGATPGGTLEDGVLVTGVRTGPGGGGERQVVLRCTARSCRQVLSVPSSVPLHLAAGASGMAGDVAAFSAGDVYLSHDGGRSFTLLASFDGHVTAAAVVRSGVMVSVRTADGRTAVQRVVGGAMPVSSAIPAGGDGVDWLQALPRSGVVVAVRGTSVEGAWRTWCSSDGGIHWVPAC